MAGELDLTFRDQDPQRVAALLSDCAELNRTFLDLASPVMNELVSSGHASKQALKEVTV